MTCPNTDEMTLSPDQTALIEGVARIAERLFAAERDEPVAPFRTPAAMAEVLDLNIPAEGNTADAVLEELERIVLATPRTGSRRFFNQLFSGREPMAAAGEMLAALLNTTMYTYKVAGPHALIETALTRHMAGIIGYGSGEGIFSPGGSLANLAALVIARNHAGPGGRSGGVDGRTLTVYTSRDAHYSIRKACGMIGVGRDNLRGVPVDGRGRLDPDALDAMITGDRAAGRTPVAVVATAGTTVRAAYDPIGPIADVAERHGVWLHVDGAFGGSALLSRTHRHLVSGGERAESWTWDPHKLMGVPLTSSVLLTRERGVLAANFSEEADYLFQSDTDEYNHGRRSIQCGRRNDALKLWAAWKHLGDRGYEERIDRLFALAHYAAREIERRPGFTLTAEPEGVNVCFEVDGAESPAICETLRREQRAMVGHATVDGRSVIRVACANAAMTEADIDAFLDAVEAAAR
jgi:sulfinoalanine decarboxylase/sulfinoalanine decarboxylase/aspartate 1-decarboxylase